MINRLIEEKFVTQEGEPENTDEVWRKRVGFLSDEILGALVFADWKTGHVGAGGGERIDRVSLREHVPEIQDVA